MNMFKTKSQKIKAKNTLLQFLLTEAFAKRITQWVDISNPFEIYFRLDNLPELLCVDHHFVVQKKADAGLISDKETEVLTDYLQDKVDLYVTNFLFNRVYHAKTTENFDTLNILLKDHIHLLEDFPSGYSEIFY